MNLKQAREAAGLSQQALALKANIARWRLSSAENGYLQLLISEEAALVHILREAITERLRKLDAAAGLRKQIKGATDR